jgi:RNA polymerase sigma-70 factor (ECF subfamily)
MQAFEDLYERVAPRIYGLALRVLRDAHQSEEVTQEVFLQVWQTASRFDPQRGSALAWLMTIAHRRAVDRVRRSEGWRRLDAVDAERSWKAPYDATVATAHATLDAQKVREALAVLSPIQCQALELAYFGGYTYREVSALLDIPVSTAKTRVRDALIRLRATMSPVAAQPLAR